MVSMTPEEWRRVGEAVVVWTAWGHSSWPRRRDGELVHRFGATAAAELLPILRELESAFHSCGAECATRDLAEEVTAAVNRFKGQYRELPEDAVQALAWAYAYQNK
jgi:hypothetical protein